MRVIPLSTTAIDEAASAILRGEIVVHPTETCYGLACDLSKPEVVSRLFLVKARPPAKPVSALFPTVEEAKRYVRWNDRAEALAAEHLPGPLTIILPFRDDAPQRILPTPGGWTSVGVRVSSHPFAAALAAAVGRPIATTSANLHGQPVPYDPSVIVGSWGSATAAVVAPDLFVDAGTLPRVAPSTVIDLTEGLPQVRREGPVAG